MEGLPSASHQAAVASLSITGQSSRAAEMPFALEDLLSVGHQELWEICSYDCEAALHGCRECLPLPKGLSSTSHPESVRNPLLR